MHAAVNLALQLQSSRNKGDRTRSDTASSHGLGVGTGRLQRDASARSSPDHNGIARDTAVGEGDCGQQSHEDVARHFYANESDGLTAKAARLHTQALMDELSIESCQTGFNHTESDSGEALLLEVASSALPPADALWSDDDL